MGQLRGLRTQNQQLHQALQQVQQQQSQQQGLVQALSDLPQSLAQTVGAAALAVASPARTNPTLVDTKGLGKPPPLKNTEGEFVSWARRTENFGVSVHPGPRDVLTWAVERESATVAEANAATEVVMPLDTLRMLADQLFSVLMTLVEGESFDILVGSGWREGLEAWRRLHKRWEPFTTGRARGLLREILSSWTCQAGRAARSSGTTGGLDEALHAKTRCLERPATYAWQRDIKMAALEALSFRRTRATLPTPTVTVGHVSETEIKSRPLRGSKRVCCTQAGSSVEFSRRQRRSFGCWRIWTVERTKLFQRKGKESCWRWQRKRSRKRWKRWFEIIRTSEHTENSKSVLELRENRSSIQGLLGELWQMATATESRTFNFSWKGKRCEGQVRQRWWKERKIQRCWSTSVESTAESSCELSCIVYTTYRNKHNGWHG